MMMYLLVLFVLFVFDSIHATAAKPDVKVMEREGLKKEYANATESQNSIKECQLQVVRLLAPIKQLPEGCEKKAAINDLQQYVYKKLRSVSRQRKGVASVPTLAEIARQFFRDGDAVLATVEVVSGKQWEGHKFRLVAKIPGITTVNLFPIGDKEASAIWARDCELWLKSIAAYAGLSVPSCCFSSRCTSCCGICCKSHQK
jgi:hypothetical protein